MGLFRINLWQWLGVFDYGGHHQLIGLTVGKALIGVGDAMLILRGTLR